MGDINEAFQLLDGYNKQDPRRNARDGATTPVEYFLALRLHEWVRKLAPDAGENLLLASRCQHIGRWEIARSAYPEGRNGYFRWRKALTHHHAEVAAGLLGKAGYDAAEIADVQSLLRKERLGTDPRAQIMEDALCLVFLEFQYEEFSRGVTEEKMTDILTKTWKKMSEAGRKAAVSLPYSVHGAAVIAKVLSNPAP